MAPLTSALWDHFRWKLYEHTQGGSREVDALISVVRKYLTPTPTSSVGAMVEGLCFCQPHLYVYVISHLFAVKKNIIYIMF